MCVGYCFCTQSFLRAGRELVSGSSGHWHLDDAHSQDLKARLLKIPLPIRCNKVCQGRNGASVNIADDTADEIDETVCAKATSIVT